MPFQPDQLHAVVFDMDGLLIDSERPYQEAAIESASTLGFELSKELHMSTVGMPDEAGEALIRLGMGFDFPFEEYDRNLRRIMADRFRRHVPVKPGVRELLLLLSDLEIPAAVATSASRETARHHLGRAGLASRLATVVTRDDVNIGKPHPEPYLLAAKWLAVEPENCLALEDSHNGVRSAHGAGMQTIMVPDMLPATKEIAALCVAVMSDMNAVREWFLTT